MTRILSIEDDGDFQHLLGLHLRRSGYEVHYAFTGLEGWEKSLQLAPDLILLDMKLPELNGAEVLARLRQNAKTRGIPVVVVTSFFKDIPFLEKKVRKLGVVEYLRKPVRFEELQSMVRRLVPARKQIPGPVPRLVRGRLSLDSSSRTVWLDGRLVATLPPRRFALLEALVEEGSSVPVSCLLERAWSRRASRNVLEKTVERLRRDIAGLESFRIATTPDGYALVEVSPAVRVESSGGI